MNMVSLEQFQSSKDSGSLSLNIEYLVVIMKLHNLFQKLYLTLNQKKSTKCRSVYKSPIHKQLVANSVGSGSNSPENIVVKQ